MGDPLREELERLARNIERCVQFWDRQDKDEGERRLKTEGRLSTLEGNVKIILWFLGAVALAAITALAKALGK